MGRVLVAGMSWGTVSEERSVLAVVRTMTSAVRLLDVLAAFDGDPRVHVRFTLNEGSAFQHGAARFLDGLEARFVPWREAVRSRYDLAIAATSNGGLHRLRAPVLVMPHGAGHNRLVEAATGSRDIASGLAPRQLMHWGRVVPDVIALSHQEQLDRLRRSCPAAARRAVVTGDPSFDRMLASLPLRDVYRRALGVAADQRLLLLTSTWGEHSLFGRHVGQVARWMTELPLDAYRAALVLHPNVWTRHSGPQIEGWLAEALNAGLMLIRPEEGWRAALIAADAVLGDHGSVTYYGAALERPSLLGAFGDEEIDPRSPMADLGRAHPRLDLGGNLHDQLEELTATPLGRDALGKRGDALENLRDVMYGVLGIPKPPVAPRIRAVPVPEARRRDVTAMVVAGEAVGDRVALTRYPATVDREQLAEPLLLVTECEVDPRLRGSASMVVRTGRSPDPEQWTRDALHDADLAAAAIDGSRCFVRLRGGGTIIADGADVTVCAPVVLLRRLSGLPLEGKTRVSLGSRELLIGLTPPRHV